MIKPPPTILKFHGVRGSRPTHQSGSLGYGGNSTCIEIDAGLDFSLVIDSGTGLQHLTKHLGEHPHRKKIHILITHTHWDHVLFLPFIRQLSNPLCSIHFHAPDVGGKPFSELFEMLFASGRLPIPPVTIKSKLTFHRITPGVDFLIEGKIKVATFQVNHPETTLGYKIVHGESSIAVITDAASIQNGNHLGTGMLERAKLIGKSEFEIEYQDALIAFLKDVHTLVFDTHFNTKNVKHDWGHSTPEHAIEICAKANIRRLFMFHHAPEDNDSTVALKQIHARNLALPYGIEVLNAREEDQWPMISA
jgi:ribonuclease BN (tRNA processing enzyme)